MSRKQNFSKRSSNRRNNTFTFKCGGKTYWQRTDSFEIDGMYHCCIAIIIVISLPEKWPAVVAVFNFSGLIWIGDRSHLKSPFLNSSQCRVNGTYSLPCWVQFWCFAQPKVTNQRKSHFVPVAKIISSQFLVIPGTRGIGIFWLQCMAYCQHQTKVIC